MIYASPSAQQQISIEFLKKVFDNIEDVNINIDNTIDNTNPNSGKIGYIRNENILVDFFKICMNVNKETKWDLDIDSIQPLTYQEYNTNYKSKWQVDQHDELYKENNLRKISFTIFLNNDFEGGEFDMDFMSPNNEIRYQSFDNTIPLNTCLFYHSYNWFRIRPITNGIKKSLSGYILGPKYK
jgi:PKHD-type hydroxylase|tara:strand:+ start:354 stop:902 length:549 start_codon:yes stop_codon:yes gene_type:complete